MIRILWIDVYLMSPWRFSDPSTLCAGMGLTRVFKVSLWRLANCSLIINPSAPLSRRAFALISLPEIFPTIVTLSSMDG